MRHPDQTVCPDARLAPSGGPLPGHDACDPSGVNPASSFAIRNRYLKRSTLCPRKTGLAILLTGFVWSCAALTASAFKPASEPVATACALALP